MQWSIKLLLSDDDGTFSSEVNITGIIDDISVMETVGNELYGECGDLVFKTRVAIGYSSGYHNWFTLYIDNLLFGIYQFTESDYEFDEKRTIYTYRLKSIQRVFFDNINILRAGPYTGTEFYNYAIVGNSCKVSTIYVMGGDGEDINSIDQYTFSLGDMLADLSGKHNAYGFVIDTVTHPCKLMASAYDIPVFWRGRGIPDTVSSEGEAITMTFYQLTKYTFDIQDFKFTVSGVTITPGVGAVYSHNSSNYEIISTDITSGAGSLYAVRTSGTNAPLSSGTLTKVSGTGDATISFSSYAYQTEMIVPADPYGSIYSANSNNFEAIAIEDGLLTTRRVSGTSTPGTIKYLTKVSGTGDPKIGYSDWDYDTLSYDTTWFDIIKIAAVIYNCFVAIIPKIDSGFVKIDLKLIKKTAIAGTAITASWIERIREKMKYIIDGVNVNILNHVYVYGANVGSIFTKDLNIAEPRKTNSNVEIDLYAGITEQDSGAGTYDYNQPDNIFAEDDIGTEPFMDDYYDGIIGAGDGYNGTVLPTYNDGTDKILRPLDQIGFSGTTIQLTTIQIGKNFLAKIEGIKL